MDVKKVLTFTVIIILIAVWLWPSDVFKIRTVEDGNTVVLTNGTTVRLLGVSNTREGKEELEILAGKKVELLPDDNSPFETSCLDESSLVYAYLLLPDYNFECVNATLLKTGKASLVENCRDSLVAFRRYAKAPDKVPPAPPTPMPVPKLDYDGDDIVLPDYQMPSERKHSVWYVDGSKNLEMLDEACDYNLPYTKSFANQLAGRSKGSFNPGQICEIFDYCYKKWRYVNDPTGQEYVARASESIASYLTGDCDDFAVLMASCLLAVGADVCINTGHHGSGTGHAFAEVDITAFGYDDVLETVRSRFSSYKISSLNCRSDGRRKWLNLDWQAAYPGGPYYDCSSSWSAYTCINGEWVWHRLR